MIGIIVNSRNSIFISHSSVDSAVAKEIYGGLKSLGYSPWMAIVDVTGGANYAQTVIEALESSTAVVVVLTESAIKSQHVKREVNIAIDKEITLIPLNLSGSSNIMPLLSGDWKYWLTIVQIINPMSDNISKEIVEALTSKSKNISIKTDEENDTKSNSLEKLPDSIKNAKTIQKQSIPREITGRKSSEDVSAQKKDLRQKAELKEIEREKEAERIESAKSRIEGAKRIFEWLEELEDWLSEIAYSDSLQTALQAQTFDIDDFNATFDANFLLDLTGIEDLAHDYQVLIGAELVSIYFMLTNDALNGGQIEAIKKYLDLALQNHNPWAFLYQGEWLFLRGDYQRAKTYFSDSKQLQLAKAKAEQAASDYELCCRLETPMDSESEIQEGKEKEKKYFTFKWRWWELIIQLSDKNVGRSALERIFKEIDETLYKDSSSPMAVVYLDEVQRAHWKFLGSLVLLRLERNTASRNFLRGLNPEVNDYLIAESQIRGYFKMAQGDGAKFFSEMLKVLDSWR